MPDPKLEKIEGPALGDMPAEEFRRCGHELIDWIADYFEHIDNLPVLAQVEPGDLKAQLAASPPEKGESMETILADVDRLIVPALTHWSHPSFFAYFATSTSAPGIFGELLSAAFDVKSMLWRTSPASTELEEVTLDWLRQMMGLDDGFSGFIYDTASVSSMHAIAAAREGVELRIREEGMSGRKDLPLLRVYASEQAHSSIDKGIITLGLGQRSLRKIPTDDQFRMDAKALAQATASFPFAWSPPWARLQPPASIQCRQSLRFAKRTSCGYTLTRRTRVRQQSFPRCSTFSTAVRVRIRW